MSMLSLVYAGWCPFDHPLNGQATPVLDFGAIEKFFLSIIAGEELNVKQMLEDKLVDVSIVIGPQMRKSISAQCAKEVMGKSAVSLACWHGHLSILEYLLKSGGSYQITEVINTLTITCTCCYDEIKGTQDLKIYSHADSLSG